MSNKRTISRYWILIFSILIITIGNLGYQLVKKNTKAQVLVSLNNSNINRFKLKKKLAKQLLAWKYRYNSKSIDNLQSPNLDELNETIEKSYRNLFLIFSKLTCESCTDKFMKEIKQNKKTLYSNSCILFLNATRTSVIQFKRSSKIELPMFSVKSPLLKNMTQEINTPIAFIMDENRIIMDIYSSEEPIEFLNYLKIINEKYSLSKEQNNPQIRK